MPADPQIPAVLERLHHYIAAQPKRRLQTRQQRQALNDIEYLALAWARMARELHSANETARWARSVHSPDGWPQNV